MTANCRREAFGDVASARDRRPRQQRHELVPAPARSEIPAAQRTSEQFTDEHEHGITLQVAVGLIDELELIDVDHQQRTLALPSASRCDRLGGGSDEGAAQWQSGQVINGLFGQQGLRCRGTAVRAAQPEHAQYSGY